MKIFFKSWFLIKKNSSVGWPRLLSWVLHQSHDFSEVTSVWGVSAVATLDYLLNVYACGQQKALIMLAYCVVQSKL